MSFKFTVRPEQSKDEAGPSSPKSSRRLSLIGCVLALGIFCLSVANIWNARQDAWREAENASQNLLTAVARDLRSNFELFDRSLGGVIAGLKFLENRNLPADVRKEILFDRAVRTSTSRAILLLDERGDMIAASTAVTPRRLNFADREYFKIHQTSPERGLYVSRPFPDRLGDGKPIIVLSRRISRPDGGFAGVVAGGLTIAELTRSFDDLRLGRKGSITLHDANGTLMTRQPFVPDLVGRDFSQSPNIQRMFREGSGSFIGYSAVDGVERNFTFTRIEGLPLLVHVATSVDDIFAGWRQRALIQGVSTAVLCATVIVLLVLFRRELRRRETAEANLDQIAKTDSLTGLANRRAFDVAFMKEWAAAQKANNPLSLLFIDADFFKGYNDQYGHGSGDTLLRRIAEVVKAQTRSNIDLAARYGGEEFTVLLPAADASTANYVAQRIRDAVCALQVQHDRSPHRIITVSVGVATAYPATHSHPDSLLTAADAALYQAKAAGRNFVHAA